MIESSGSANSRSEAREPKAEKKGGSFLARFGVALMCLTPCAILGIIAGGGKTTYLTASCVVGAVLSTIIMQATGLMPKKQAKPQKQ